jgi:hypothetical protein
MMRLLPTTLVPTPSLSDHDSEIFAETDGPGDMPFSANNNIRHDSDVDGSNTNMPEINRDIESKDDSIADKIIPSSEPAPSLSERTNDTPNLATVDANPSASRRPKRTIKPRLRADQADISDNDCANSDCEDLKASGEMIMCAALGCRSKVGLVLSSRGNLAGHCADMSAS